MNTQPASKDDPAISPLARRAAAVCDWFANLSAWGWIAIVVATFGLLAVMRSPNHAGAGSEKKAWLATQSSVELIGKVEAVHPNGIIVKKAPDFISRTQMIISAGPPFYFVVAHPRQQQLAEGESVTMFGVRDGNETIQTPNGYRVLARYHWMPSGKSLN